ncbi:hypothetical protein AcV5_008095 [Taiwanofungus camphoratus]|nr:hypothetical protein AcV5_008095 [Antrodia cinnamomea]
MDDDFQMAEQRKYGEADDSTGFTSPVPHATGVGHTTGTLDTFDLACYGPLTDSLCNPCLGTYTSTMQLDTIDLD